MSAIQQCNICPQPDSLSPDSETAEVRSNIRRFRDERFTVWRCRACRSIHARDPVDLDHYYRHYPFHTQKLDWALRTAYRNLVARLKRSGLNRHHSALDFGCGSGHLVRFLKSQGFDDVAGYDSYSPEFSHVAALDRQYDCIVSQDVIEHVHEPRDLLDQFSKLVKPGGLIAIGTPNAESIDLTQPETHVHTLHQPYHTHMLSKTALIAAAEKIGWKLVRLFPSSYVNTKVPFVNLNFGLHYGRCFDNTLDLAFEPFRISPKLLTPRAIWLAFFGYFRCPDADMMVVFRAGD